MKHIFCLQKESSMSLSFLKKLPFGNSDIYPYFSRIVENKTAAQAAGQTLPDATPPVGKINPFAQNRCNFGTNTAI